MSSNNLKISKNFLQNVTKPWKIAQFIKNFYLISECVKKD